MQSIGAGRYMFTGNFWFIVDSLYSQISTFCTLGHSAIIMISAYYHNSLPEEEKSVSLGLSGLTEHLEQMNLANIQRSILKKK